MLQVVLNKPGELVAASVAEPDCADGEALLRISRVGVCGTDLHAFRGRQPFFNYPRVLGHELAARVVRAPAGSGLSEGDLVAVEPYLACGRCRTCRAGRTNCCLSLQVLGVHRDGGMCEFLTMPPHLLHRSRELSADQLALVETLGIGYHAVKRAAVQPEEVVVVVGAGPIGLAVTQLAVTAGARVAVVDPIANRRDLAGHLEADWLVDPAAGAVDEQLASLVGDELAHVAFDATGSLACMKQTLRLAGPGGRVVMVGLAMGEFAVDDPLFHRRELTLLASRNSAGAFPQLISLMEEGSLDTRLWITHRMDLQAVPGRFKELLDPASGVVKAVVSAD